jgi:hypothetical protein
MANKYWYKYKVCSWLKHGLFKNSSLGKNGRHQAIRNKNLMQNVINWCEFTIEEEKMEEKTAFTEISRKGVDCHQRLIINHYINDFIKFTSTKL